MKARALYLVVLFLFSSILFSANNSYAQSDVSSLVQVNESRMMYDRRTGQYSYNVSLTNTSAELILSPVKVVIDSISSTLVTVANADGTTAYGKPYFLYDGEFGDGNFEPGETSIQKKWAFNNPSRARFSYTTSVLGDVVEAFGTIGPEGGVVEVTDPNSPIYGTIVEIPANALSEDKIITIEETNLSSSLPDGVVDAGPFVYFGPSGTDFFSQAYVTLPYYDEDNDGFIDYTDVPESELKIGSFDEVSQIWDELVVVSQDTENNMVTFATESFSTKVSILTLNCNGPAFIFTIDGLKPSKMIRMPDNFAPSYLREAILDMELDDDMKPCVISYSGPNNSPKDRWNGDAYKTEEIMSDLNETLKTYFNKFNDKKFIIVTHSWGTILGMLALKYNDDINPDLFITLSSPYGTKNVTPTLPVPEEVAIFEFTENKINDTYDMNGDPSRVIADFDFNWTNYWAKGDLISGPFNIPSVIDFQVDAGFGDIRSVISTPRWHAITKLHKDSMGYDELNSKYKSYADSLIEQVKSEIITVIVNPQIDQTPMSGSPGTTFMQWGTGFAPNGYATLHFLQPDMTESPSLLVQLDDQGHFEVSYTAPSNKPPGTYTWWAVDLFSSKSSNLIEYTIDISPVLAQTPMSGPPGTTFVQWGTGFTPNGTATLHFQKPDGSEYPTESQTLDSTGHFEVSYTAPSNKPAGTYSWWAIDDTTSIKSNEINYTVITVNPTIAQSPMTASSDTPLITCYGTGFTPNGYVDIHFFAPNGSEVGKAHTRINNAGSFVYPYTVSGNQASGTYKWYAIDETTGIKSNEITFVFIGKPNIDQSPLSGPPGTKFWQTGWKFTSDGTATLHFQKPDGTEYPTQTQQLNSWGGFGINYYSPLNKAPGIYTWWAVDDTTGQKSNEVTYTITVNPTIAQSPMSGPPGTTFSQWGEWFTPNGTATLHFRKPDGSEYPTELQTLDSTGHFEVSYTAPSDKPAGTYTWWVVDNDTGIKSNEINYTVAVPTISQTPMSVSSDTPLFTCYLTGFTPNGRVDFYLFAPNGINTSRGYINNVNNDGSYSWTKNVTGNQASGTYKWYAIDETTGIKSNEITFVFIGKPRIHQSLLSGPPGTTFFQSGSRFTSDGTATLHFLKPDGTEYPTQTQQLDSWGGFGIYYHAPFNKLAGAYTWWAVDDTTGQKSNEVTYTITVNPRIGQHPMSGPPGTTFSQWGEQFTPNGTATLHFRKPDGSEYPTKSQTLDSVGFFAVKYTPSNKPSGTYTWWAVDNDTGIKSNEVTYTIIVNPTIAQAPMSGPPGNAFVQWGTGFTPNGTATLHFQKPDGSEYPTESQTLDSVGFFAVMYNAPSNKPAGAYTWWAVDDATGQKSNEVTYTITVNPTIAQSPMSGPPGTTFSQWGTGFTPDGYTTLHFQKPDGSEYPSDTVKLDAAGHFEVSYTAPLDKPAGTYTWWAVDLLTGMTSNSVSYVIQ